MQDRLKILDASRKAILGLRSGALHLWLCYYMNEDEEQESFMSYAEIEAQTGMGKTSIQKWNHYLAKHGWIIDTKKTAHDKWLALGKVPTADSARVTCWRVDDPTAKLKQVADSYTVSRKATDCGPSESDYKVSCSSSVSGSGSPLVQFASHSGSEATPPAVEPEGNGENRKPQNPKPRTRRTAKDGTPVPMDLDKRTLEERLAWSRLHNGTGEPATGSAPDGMVTCHCGIRHEAPMCPEDLDDLLRDEYRALESAARGEEATPKPKTHTLTFCAGGSPDCELGTTNASGLCGACAGA